MIIKANDVELEMLQVMGMIYVMPDGQYRFILPPGWNIKDAVNELEQAITYAESDAGDWLRAKQFREAKSGLLDKLRAAQIKRV